MLQWGTIISEKVYAERVAILAGLISFLFLMMRHLRQLILDSKHGTELIFALAFGVPFTCGLFRVQLVLVPHQDQLVPLFKVGNISDVVLVGVAWFALAAFRVFLPQNEA